MAKSGKMGVEKRAFVEKRVCKNGHGKTGICGKMVHVDVKRF